MQTKPATTHLLRPRQIPKCRNGYSVNETREKKELKLNILKWGKHSITLFCYSLCFRHRLLFRLLSTSTLQPLLTSEFHLVALWWWRRWRHYCHHMQGTLNQTCTLNSPQCVSGIGQLDTQRTHTYTRITSETHSQVNEKQLTRARRRRIRQRSTNAKTQIKVESKLIKKCNKDWYGSWTRILIYFNLAFIHLYIIGCRAY